MDPLHFSIAVAPLGVYLLLMGIINLMRRPFITTGARDAATLGIAISGLMLAGPMELFFPEGAASRFGGFVWLLLIAFYGLCVSLVVLLMRPRLVIYNTTVEKIRPILADVAMQLDNKARWTGDSLMLPTLDVQLNLEGASWLNNIQLVAIGQRQSHEGWRALERKLRAETKSVKTRPTVLGFTMIASAIGLGVLASTWMLARQQEVAQALFEMLRR